MKPAVELPGPPTPAPPAPAARAGQAGGLRRLLAGRLERWLDPLALAALALAALVLHRDGLFGGPAYYESDTQLFYYPLAQWVSAQLKAGSYPLWLPGIFTGYPIFADGELGLLYLPQVALLALLPTSIAIVWLRVLHVFLAGAFMHLFLRTLRLSPLAALGGALIFAFGSFTTAQMHHENVIRSAVWLPLVLALADRSLRAAGRRRWGWAALSALAYAQAALGLHVQPVLMMTLALAGFILFRLLLGWPGGRLAPLRWPRRSLANQQAQGSGRRAGHAWLPSLAAAVALGSATVLGGLAIAAAQWLPLAEWARASYRAGGVSYEFASAFGLAPENLPTLLFPYFFRLPDGRTWWTLWQQWETHLYAGIPTLALAPVGVLLSRRREVAYFLPLGVLALLVGMTHYSPTLNLHELLWSLPGFSFLRAPGRFTYLVVFALAGLAALGLQALQERRAWLNRLLVAVVGAVPAVALLAAVLALFPAWRAWLLADPARGRAAIEASYLTVRAQYPLSAEVVYRGLLASLDLATLKTAWTLVLLALSALGFVGWLALGPRRAPLGQALFVALLAVDLLVFAADFHPRAPLASLEPSRPAGIGANARVMLGGARSLPWLQPDQLLAAGVSTIEGYSSLPSQRHEDLYARTQGHPGLLRVWSAPFVIEPTRPDDAHQADGVAFRADHPLAAGYQGNASTRFRVAAATSETVALRLVGTLSYAFDVPQGTEVGEVRVIDRAGVETRLPIRAGVELAERAIDRPSLQPFLRHHKPPGPTALDFNEVSPAGEAYVAHLYLAAIPLPAPARVAEVAIVPTHPRALVQVYGISLVDAAGGVRSLGLQNLEGMRVATEGVRYRVLTYADALPRAYVVDRRDAISRGSHPEETPVQIMAGPGFDPATNVLVEDGSAFGTFPPLPAGRASAGAGAASPGTGQPPRPAEVEELGPNALRITARADRSAYLVVDDAYHRGWAAWVDGQQVPVLIANAAFRAVPLEPGQHVVELRFQPLSHLVGGAISATTLLAALGTIALGFLRRRAGAE